MATFEDLEAEVQKLRQTVRQLSGANAAADNARAVDEIVSTADGDEKLIAEGGGVPGHKMSDGVQHIGQVPSDVGKFDQDHGIATGAGRKDDGE